MAVAVVSPKILVGSYNWTSNASQAEVGADVATQDVTTFEFAANGFTNAVPGLKAFVFNSSGYNDNAVGALDEWLRSNYGTRRVVSVALTGETTTAPAVVANGLLGGYRTVNASVGGVPTTVGTVSDGVFAEGQVTTVSTSTLTATANSTPVNIGAVAAGRSIYAAIHVVSVTGTTPSLTAQIQSSTTSGGAYTNRGTAGSALTAAGDQWLSAAGAFTDTWWRIAYTISGTTPVFTVFAALAIT